MSKQPPKELQKSKQFEELVRIHLDAVYAFCLKYMRTQVDAEEAAQEAFVKAWKNFSRYDFSRDFKNWIFEIAKNTCLDMIKKKKALPFSTFEDADGSNFIAESFVSDEILPHEYAEQSLTQGTVRAAVSKLAPIYKKVLEMYYQRGLNFREIAEALDESLDTIKSRHRRAIISLRKIFDQE